MLFQEDAKTMMRSITALLTTGMLAAALPAHAADAPLRPDQQTFRDTYKELVETNTTLSAGSCTLAAERMAARLRAGGMPDSAINLYADPAHPKDGGLVAVYPGTSRTLKPMLLLAHIDVVEANRADWVRDPFTLIEEDGYFYARGTVDDKAQAAIWTDMLARFARESYKPKRTIKLALTCGEETSGAFNGAEWLTVNHKNWIDAEFALNEGGLGQTDGHGKVIAQTIQIGEKAYEDFTLTVTNPGGHSSQPLPENAIYRLAAALQKVGGYEFPVQMNDTTRAFFRINGAARRDETGAAMQAIAANPSDQAAEAVLNRDKMFHSMLRTTCVATMIGGGHALNALPQRVTANVNCRMFPGNTAQQTEAALTQAIGDNQVKIERRLTTKPLAIVPPLDPRLMRPAQTLMTRYFPGVPFVPTMSTGATDAVYTGAIGIPTYGVPGLYVDPDFNGLHGLNERMEVRALYTGRDFLTEYVKALASK